MHTIFVVNGFCLNTTAASNDFRPLKTMLESKGYKVVPVDVLWNYRTVTEFAQRFSDIYANNKTESNTVLGNSFGAMVALLTAPNLQPDLLLLCSLSCFFKEDLHRYNQKQLLRRFGKKRLADFQTLSADSLADQIEKLGIKTILTYGEFEKKRYPELVYRVRDTASKINSTELFELPDALHSIMDTQYVSALSEVLPQV